MSHDVILQFRAVFPDTDDYYCAVAFFTASGLSEARAHTLAEDVSRPAQCEQATALGTTVAELVK